MAVKYLLKKWNSLRTRIILSVLIMLIPASVLMYSSYNSITGSLNSITDIVDTRLSKLVFAKRIQTKILRTELPFHLYLNRGETGDRESFIKRSVEIDILFDTIGKTETLSSDDAELIMSSRHEWQKAKNLGESLLTITNIPPNHILIDKVDKFGRHLERSASLLDEVAELSIENINNIQFKAQNNEWKNIGMLILIYGLGMLLALLAALSLGQSIIEPIFNIKQSVIRFSEGDTRTRIKLQSNDELSSLAQAFNTLAERYEQTQLEVAHLSIFDSLTGLFDKAKLHSEINIEIERSKRYERAFSVLFVDINNFTKVNQTYGRLVGDSVLCSVANIIRNTVRPTDLATRFNNDEFAIILSETDTYGAYEAARRIFEAIENEALNIGDGKKLAVTVSIGCATYPTNASSDAELLALAKTALPRSRFNQKAKMRLL